jgi:hypothetical protein
VRLLAVEGCAKFGSLLDHEDCVAYVLPIVQKFAVDKSWRVRYMVAQQLYELCEAVGPELSRTELVPAYVKLLKVNTRSLLPPLSLLSLHLTIRVARAGGWTLWTEGSAGRATKAATGPRAVGC